jgi:hypothetical protein
MTRNPDVYLAMPQRPGLVVLLMDALRAEDRQAAVDRGFRSGVEGRPARTSEVAS